MTCVGQVEIDDYCTAVLEKHWPRVPRWRDIRALPLAALPCCDLVCGGYPCQPFSSAGQRRGAEDDRHLWPFVLGVVHQVRPTWCLFENVAGHVSLGLDRVWSDLEAAGYAVQPLIIPACAVGAPHRRDRVWILANAQGHCQWPRLRASAAPGERGPRPGHGRDGAVADAPGRGRDGLPEQQGKPSAGRGRPAAHGIGGGALAHTQGLGRREGEPEPGLSQWDAHPDGAGAAGSGVVGNTHGTGFPVPQQPGEPGPEECGQGAWPAAGQRGGSPWAGAEWVLCRDGRVRAVAPGVPLLAHGIPERVGQAKAYGNTVIPDIVEIIGRAILAAQQEAA